MTLGELITNNRKEKGWTIIEAAKKINVSKMTYVRLESDQTKYIPFDNIINVVNTFGLDFFRVMQILKKNLTKLELETAFKIVKRFYYKGELLNCNKLDKLIEDNLEKLME